MTKAHRLIHRKPADRALDKGVRLNFLLGCSDNSLNNYELARLSEASNLRKELHEILDKLIDTLNQAAMAAWFRQNADREALKSALENEESALEWANRKIRERQRSEQELEDLIPLPSLEPGAAHLAAAMRYQERNIEEGKCQNCPEPLDPRSHRYCTKHLEAQRLRYTPKQQRLEPGMISWLYGETPEKGREKYPRQKMRRVSEAGKELLERVAKELGMTTQHVRKVALGDVHSETVLKALFAAFEKMPGSQNFLAPKKAPVYDVPERPTRFYRQND